MVARTSRRRLMASPLALGIAGVSRSPLAAHDQGATPAPPRHGTWPLYGQNLHGTRASDAGISSRNVGDLRPLWEVEVDGPVSATPVIAGEVAYVGSYDGSLYALDLYSGDARWNYATGAVVPEPNLQIPLGITGSAAIVDDTVYVGDAAAVVHAIDSSTGSARWTTTVDDQPNASIWSSPVVSRGKLYVGVASIAKETGFRGSLVALDAATGAILRQTYMVPESADGAGVFAVPAIDEERSLLYVGTQNAYSANPQPYGNPISIVALDVENGEIAWVFNAPPGGEDTAPTEDVGFSASPNLFSAEIDGERRDLIGEGQKSGDYWALDRESGDVVWQAKVSPAGFLGGMEGTSAVAGRVVAVPATDWPEFEGPASGLVTGLDVATGETRWSVAQEMPTASPAGISRDVVFHAGIDGVLHARHLETGDELFSHDLQASVSGGIAAASGVVVLGAATPSFASFVKPGSTIRAFGVDHILATPG